LRRFNDGNTQDRRILAKTETVMIATGLVLVSVTSRDQDGIVRPPDAMIETRTVTVEEIVTAMIIVEAKEMTAAERGKIIHAATGTMIRMWKRMTQGDGETTVNGMREWLLGVNVSVNVFETGLRAKMPGNRLMTVMGDGGRSSRSVIAVANEALVVTEDRVFKMTARRRTIAKTASVNVIGSGRRSLLGWILTSPVTQGSESSAELAVKESSMAYKHSRRA
jgi:hypothetical protein